MELYHNLLTALLQKQQSQGSKMTAHALVEILKTNNFEITNCTMMQDGLKMQDTNLPKISLLM